MSANPAAAAAAEGAAKPKSNLIKIIALVVLVLVLMGAAIGGTWFFMKKNAAPAGKGGGEHASASSHDGDDDDEDAPAEGKRPPPVYLPLDNMVVNLTDGDRFAQLGVTLELADEKTVEQVKLRLPAVRTSILVLTSQRSAEELLRRDGKDKLAQDIAVEVSRVLGMRSPRPLRTDEGEKRALIQRYRGPIRAVMFASFIVQ